MQLCKGEIEGVTSTLCQLAVYLRPVRRKVTLSSQQRVSAPCARHYYIGLPRIYVSSIHGTLHCTHHSGYSPDTLLPFHLAALLGTGPGTGKERKTALGTDLMANGQIGCTGRVVRESNRGAWRTCGRQETVSCLTGKSLAFSCSGPLGRTILLVVAAVWKLQSAPLWCHHSCLCVCVTRRGV